MKQYLLPAEGQFYKANLHCHSTISDGRKTPEELKAIYQALGYAIIAYTDHNVFIPHNDLTDASFLALNGFELDVNEGAHPPRPYGKCCHICYVALKPEQVLQPMWNERHLFGNAPNYKDLVQYDRSLPPYERKYTGEAISEMMRIGREQGFFVTYNHPTWSRESYPDYIGYEGMHAFEMFNGGCLAEGYEDYNPRVYDDLLNAGRRIWCIGADDNHNHRQENSRAWDSDWAYTVIKADELQYETITDALLKGHFYSSEGPRISALWIEDGRIHIECSEADRIICTYQARKAGFAYAENGHAVTSASFPVSRDYGYVRLTVIDGSGKHACTNAYFPE